MTKIPKHWIVTQTSTRHRTIQFSQGLETRTMSSSVFFSINDAQSVQKRVSAILFPSIFQIPADTQFFVKSPQRRRDIFYISGRDVCLRKLLRARGTRRTLGECACVVLLIRSRTVSAHTQPHEIYIYMDLNKYKPSVTVTLMYRWIRNSAASLEQDFPSLRRYLSFSRKQGNFAATPS